MFQVLVEHSFNFLSAEYLDLFNRSRATAFQHPLWLHHLYTMLLNLGSDEPLVVTVRSQADGRLLLVLPLVRRRVGLMTVVEFADLGVSDYAEPVSEQAEFARILHDDEACFRIRDALAPFDFLRIKKLRNEHLPLERLLQCSAPVRMDMCAYGVELRPTFAHWRSTCLNRSFQKELDKKKRQLARKGNLRFECVRDSDSIRAVFESMRRYRQPRFQGRSKGEGDLLQRPTFFDFYLAIALEGRDGFARTYAMWLDDAPIAATLGLAHAGHLLVILGGFDLERFKNQSIGALLFEEVAKDCIERSDRVLDFTIGDEPYKRLYGAAASDMWTISSAGSRLGSVGGFMVDRVPWMKDMAKKLLRRGPVRA